MSRLIILSGLLALVGLNGGVDACTAQSAATKDLVGIIKRVRGACTITPPSGDPRALTARDELSWVRIGEEIRCEAGGRVEMWRPGKRDFFVGQTVVVTFEKNNPYVPVRPEVNKAADLVQSFGTPKGPGKSLYLPVDNARVIPGHLRFRWNTATVRGPVKLLLLDLNARKPRTIWAQTIPASTSGRYVSATACSVLDRVCRNDDPDQRCLLGAEIRWKDGDKDRADRNQFTLATPGEQRGAWKALRRRRANDDYVEFLRSVSILRKWRLYGLTISAYESVHAAYPQSVYHAQRLLKLYREWAPDPSCVARLEKVLRS